MRARIVAAVLLVTVAACGSEAATPTTTAGIVGADGATVVVASTERIVSLSGAITEIVYELGLGESVVAVDVTTVFPPPATSLPIIGVGRFLNAEAVLEQQPTLVIGDTQTSPPEAIAQIRGAGVPVLITAAPTSFDGLYANIELMGRALQTPSEAAALVARISADIDAASAPAGVAGPTVAFVYSRGPDVILLFGAEMTTRPLIEAAGAIDAGAASGVVGTVDFTPEAIVAAEPDVIVITSEGLDVLGGVEGLLAIPGFSATPAGLSGSILDYPEGDILTFGPRIAESLQLLVADLGG